MTGEQWATVIAVGWVAASIVVATVWHLGKVGSRKLAARRTRQAWHRMPAEDRWNRHIHSVPLDDTDRSGS